MLRIFHNGTELTPFTQKHVEVHVSEVVEDIDDSALDPSRVDACLAICRTCEHLTTEPLTADDDPGLLVRTVGNVIGRVMRTFGVKAMRCAKCGCFVTLKARLLAGSGCPLNKWPNDPPHSPIA